MTQSDMVTEILEQLWPDECELVGRSNVRDVISGDLKFESVSGASNIDLGSTLTLLASAATAIKTTIDIYDYLKNRLGRTPANEEIMEEQGKRLETGSKIDLKHRKALTEEVLKKKATQDS